MHIRTRAALAVALTTVTVLGTSAPASAVTRPGPPRVLCGPEVFIGKTAGVDSQGGYMLYAYSLQCGSTTCEHHYKVRTDGTVTLVYNSCPPEAVSLSRRAARAA
ncbi:hypothetical protein AB0H43_03185 [Hamadaea sp. NPDC050747]|uniref:hypothetical protein n=1 Tax=Hamadaea sp. NPDC050747 TaxID=3155789 RepID=UPI0033F074E1